ncbi:MAG TPA: hypothetical protein DFS52_19600 [Myxococcales bacterium]|jgi:hypothetical protein|nr:hypothetical protein [Myxococcales bacterium]
MKRAFFALVAALGFLAGCGGVECGEGTQEAEGKCVPVEEESGLSQPLQARCALHCDRSSEDEKYCSAEDEAACLERCHVKMSGLSEGCGICLLDSSYPLGYDCDGSLDPPDCSCHRESIEPITSSFCTSYCAAE